MSIYLHNSTLIHAHTYSLSCARVLTTPCTCCHPCFHAQKCSKDPRRCWCALSSQEKSQVKDAACVQLNAPLPLVCLCARTRELAHALCVCVCLCYRRKYLSVCGPPARLTFSYTHTAAASICSSCGRGLFVVASNVNLEEEDRRELQARASSTMFEQYENFSPPHTSLIRCTILIL